MHSCPDAFSNAYDFNNAKLTKRFSMLLDCFTESPVASIPEACRDKAAIKAAYRFFSSKSFSTKAIYRGMTTETVQRIPSKTTLLSIQDTTLLDFRTHPATTGLGYLSKKDSHGMLLHTAFAVSEAGLPLGVLDARMWTRNGAQYGKRANRRAKGTAEKESSRWLETEAAVEAHVPSDVSLVSISDRESDIYDYIARPRRAGHDLLIRLCQNRRMADRDEHRLLFEHLDSLPVQHQCTITVTDHTTGKSRQASMTYRWDTVTLVPPRNGVASERHPVTVTVILVREVDAPENVTPIEWKLLTTLAVNTIEDVLRIVRWYSYRWLIERYFYALKSGCAIEKLQLETAERLERAIVTYMIVAWRLMYMTYKARIDPDASAEEILAPHEWEALYCTIHKTQTPPAQTPTMREAVRMIAQLGGFLGRKRDGEPGMKVTWRGFRRLMDIAATYKLFVYDRKERCG
jgi:hypothetical protein